MARRDDPPCFRNPFWVAPQLAPILEEMLVAPSPAYRDAARLACQALRKGSLAGIQTSFSRFLILLRELRARPVPANVGALFQCIERRSPPNGKEDLPGWIVVQNGYGGGRLVLVHELSHFANRFEVWTQRNRWQPDCPLRGWSRAIVAAVRARLLDEVAARHVAFLGESNVDPDDPRQRWPEQGALFACAVKIASYPEIYADPGYVSDVASAGRDALRDLVGAWMPGLTSFSFFRPGTTRARAHGAWLCEEARIASRGANAPDVDPEGTL